MMFSLNKIKEIFPQLYPQSSLIDSFSIDVPSFQGTLGYVKLKIMKAEGPKDLWRVTR